MSKNETNVNVSAFGLLHNLLKHSPSQYSPCTNEKG